MKPDTSWKDSFDKDTENYISQLPWSDKTPDLQKTLVIGNIRGFAEHIKKGLADLPALARRERDEEWKKKIGNALLAEVRNGRRNTWLTNGATNALSALLQEKLDTKGV